MTGPVKALRDLADEQDAEAQRCEDHAKHHRQQAQYFANLAQQATTNAEAYREAANTLATLHSAGATLEGATLKLEGVDKITNAVAAKIKKAGVR